MFLNLGDIVCLLDTFAGITCSSACEDPQERQAPREAKDIAPCPSSGDPNNMGDNVINGDDVLAALDAFGGNPACSQCGGTGGMMMGPPSGSDPALENDSWTLFPNDQQPAANATMMAAIASGPDGPPSMPGVETGIISLVPREGSATAGGSILVDAFIGPVSNLRAYQVAVEISGPAAHEAAVVAVSIETERPDYVFAGDETRSAVNVARCALLNVRVTGGVPVVDRAYLGTFTLTLPAEASGSLSIHVRTDTETLLYDATSHRLNVAAPQAATIDVQ